MHLLTLVGKRLEHVRNAKATRQAIEARQLAKFRRLVRHAAARSPYYADVIRQHRIDPDQCRPQDFPILTKAQVMENFDRLVTDRRVTRAKVTAFLESSKDPNELMDGAYYVVHTSGSSGEPGLFVYSRQDWTRGVTQALRINPFKPGKRRLAFYGASEGHFTGVTFAATCRKPPLSWIYDVAVFDVNQPLGLSLEGLNQFQPTILMGYASALALLAERQQAGQLHITPEFVQSSAEPVAAADRASVETTFGVPLLNVYSCTEHLIMGFSHPGFGGMYLLEDDLIFELAGDQTIVTNLFNATQPLIRYQMSDVLTAIPDPHPVLPFTKVSEVAGRREHMPFFANPAGTEDFIHPAAIIEFLVPGVRRFQMAVFDKTACEMRLCLDPGLSETERSAAIATAETRFRDIFRAKNLGNVRTSVRVVDALEPDPNTRKFRLIVPAESAATVPVG